MDNTGTTNIYTKTKERQKKETMRIIEVAKKSRITRNEANLRIWKASSPGKPLVYKMSRKLITLLNLNEENNTILLADDEEGSNVYFVGTNTGFDQGNISLSTQKLPSNLANALDEKGVQYIDFTRDEESQEAMGRTFDVHRGLAFFTTVPTVEEVDQTEDAIDNGGFIDQGAKSEDDLSSDNTNEDVDSESVNHLGIEY